MNRRAKLAIPAVVVGGGLNSLGIVRSLSRRGVPVFVVANGPKAIAARSRFGRKVLLSKLDGADLVNGLMEFARAQKWNERAVLFLTEEKTVRTVSENRESLKEYYKIEMPPHDRLMELMHKSGFQKLAEAFGFPIPKMLHIQSTDMLREAEKMRYPCVLKPAQKDYAYGARFKKAYVVRSSEEVARLYREISTVLPDLVLQEWIEGDDSDIYFCLQYVGLDGATVSSFTGRKIRSWPLRVGGTASCTAAWDEAAELSALTSSFFASVHFSGMGSMEYKRDRRDGKFYMVEPTVGRSDFQEEVATLNGVNIPLAAYHHELGLGPLIEQRKSPQRVWREPVTDRWAFEENNGVQDERSQDAVIVDAFWRLNDPMPWLCKIASRLKARTKKTIEWI